MDFCNSLIFNTGLPSCDVQPGKPVGLIFAAKSLEITEADESDLLGFFEAASRGNDRSKRAYPITGEFSTEAANTEPTIESLAGTSYSEKLADGVLASKFSFPMTLCRAKAYKGLDGYKGAVFILTDNGILLGERTKRGTLRGLNVNNVAVSVDALFKDAAMKTVSITATFGSDTQLIRSVDAIRYYFDAADLSGLIAVKLKKVAALTYRVETTCGGVNLYGEYADTLSQNKDLWVVRNINTGAAIALSTITKVAGSEAFLLTPSAALGAPYRIGVSLAGVGALTSAGIVGFEQPEQLIDSVTA